MHGGGRRFTNPLAEFAEYQRRAIRDATLGVDCRDRAAQDSRAHHRPLSVGFQVHLDARARAQRAQTFHQRATHAQIHDHQAMPGPYPRA